MNNTDHNQTDTSRTLIHIPDSWLRLVTVIKHQANAGNFIFIEAPHKAGKTTFAEILLKKLTLVDDLQASYQNLHPLSNTQQILANINDPQDLQSVVILDDVAEVDASIIEELISTNLEHFFVILAEPELVNRVPRLQNSRFILPLFNKEDCHKLLSKMYRVIDPTIEIPILQSELVYYESKGFPGKMVSLGDKLKEKLTRQTSGIKSFDIANKGLLSSGIIIAGFVIFLLYLFFSDSKDGTIEIPNMVENQNEPIEQQSDELTIGTINESVVNEGEAKVETGELLLVDTKPKTFADWVKQQNQEDYTIQLYSNSSEAETMKFKSELDLADSYVYSAKVKGQTTYRLVWGVYPNRARAQLAVQSLPKEILTQKPWLRPFRSIQAELIVPSN